MHDEAKTKTQLIEELEALRVRVAELEALGTGQRPDDEALQDGEGVLKATLDSTADGILAVDLNGRVIFANKRFAELWRIPPDLLEAGDDNEMLEFVQGQLEAPEPFLSKVRELYQSFRDELDTLRFRDGRVFERYSRALVRGGKLAGRVWSFRNVSARARAEEALRESELKHRTILERIEEGYYEVDLAGSFTFFNDAMRNILGYSDEEMPGLNYREYMDEQNAAEVYRLFNQVYCSGISAQALDWQLIRKDGSRRAVETSVSLMRDAAGRPCGFRGISRDVTERRRAEEERRALEIRMQEVQKLDSLGVLAGGIAHDFNNLLMTILGNAELALDEVLPGSIARPCIQDIEIAAKRAADLTRQMLAYSGRGQFLVEPIDLSELVAAVAHLLEASISKMAALKLHLAPALPRIEADAAQMRQVVMNLVLNASEALGTKSGVITVTTGVRECDRAYFEQARFNDALAEGRYIHLTVADTGCGMDTETEQRIFEPFFTTKFLGRGLGLAAVLGIVRSHDGAIMLDTTPGEGTTLTVLFPVHRQPPPDAPEAEPGGDENAWRGSGTILFVDDEESLRTTGTRMLEHIGFHVLTAADGQEGVETFARHADEIACVVLDLTMPRMGGEDAFEAIRSVNPSVPVILCSGYSEEEFLSRFAGKGFAAFMHKPYHLAELVAAVKRALERQGE